MAGGIYDNVSLAFRALVSVAGAIHAFSQSPLSRASRSFRGSILKGMSGRRPFVKGLVEALRTYRVRSCLRPHMRAPPSILFCRWRSEVSSLSRRASLLTSHPAGSRSRPLSRIRDGRASKERHHSVKTTLGATPKIGDVPSDHRTACRRNAARFRRRLDGGFHNCTLRHHTINDKSP